MIYNLNTIPVFILKRDLAVSALVMGLFKKQTNKTTLNKS